MNIASQPHIFFPMALLLAVAAVFDWRERRIPNALIGFGILCGFSLQGTFSSVDGVIIGATGFVVGFLLLLPGFLLRFTGAGDVKLLGTLGIYLGPVDVLKVFICSIFIASLAVLLRGFLSVRFSDIGIHMSRYKSMVNGFLTTGQWVYRPPCGDSLLGARVPMAPVFAVATALLLPSSSFSLGVWRWI